MSSDYLLSRISDILRDMSDMRHELICIREILQEINENLKLTRKSNES